MTPEKLKQMLAMAFREGFAVSLEGFNGECRYDHLCPDGLSLDELCEITVNGILQDETDNVQRAVEELMPRWIPVEERLPPAEGSIVLAHYWHSGRGDGSVWQAVYAEEIGGWQCRDAEECDYGVLTHWMPLPEPPPTASRPESTPGTG